MEIIFTKTISNTAHATVLPVWQDNVEECIKELNQELNGKLMEIISQRKFDGSHGKVLHLTTSHPTISSEIFLLGLGPKEKATEASMTQAGGMAWSALRRSEVNIVEVRTQQLSELSEVSLARLAEGMLLRSWQFTKYKSKQPEAPTYQLRIVTENPEPVEAKFNILAQVAEGVFFTRNIVSEPANVLYPESFAEELSALKKLGVKIEVMGAKKLKSLGMGALLGVAQGSDREPQVVVMHWQGGDKKEAPLAFVGKGVTFDTGGISLKPAKGMEDMKADMGGAGVVGGLMKALAIRKANVNVVGIVGLVENMPSGTAQRPGDIVKSMSGKTIEVLNTDAEGRLVLCDILWYTQEEYKPRLIVDLATLTGAIVVSLGSEYAGLFSNDETLCQHLTQAGELVGEKVWRFPLHKNYDKLMDCPAADMQNIASKPVAGSITAAQFLQRFIKDGTPWAHLDIAGVSWVDHDQPVADKGASAFGVRLLDNMIAYHYEKATG